MTKKIEQIAPLSWWLMISYKDTEEPDILRWETEIHGAGENRLNYERTQKIPEERISKKHEIQL